MALDKLTSLCLSILICRVRIISTYFIRLLWSFYSYPLWSIWTLFWSKKKNSDLPFFLFQMSSQLLQYYWLNILCKLKSLLATRWLMLYCFSTPNSMWPNPNSFHSHFSSAFDMNRRWLGQTHYLGKSPSLLINENRRGTKWEVWHIARIPLMNSL